jgi:hypothetical protein
MRSFIICTSHPDIIPVMTSRRMRLARHVARIGERKNAQKVSMKKSDRK